MNFRRFACIFTITLPSPRTPIRTEIFIDMPAPAPYASATTKVVLIKFFLQNMRMKHSQGADKGHG